MTFKTQLAIDMNNVFANKDELAETATYTTISGSTKSVDVVISYDVFIQEYQGYAGRSATVICKASDIPAPEIHATFTASNGDVFAIQQIGNTDLGAHTLYCVADKRISPEGLR